MASYQYIFTMRDLRKVFPGGREVLKDITLAFFPGAKIGVIGGNGAGKSTLLRIMAGMETEFTGEAWAAEGARVGMLSQEPELDPSKDVQGNVTDGVRATKDLLDRFEAVSLRFAEEMTDDEMNRANCRNGSMPPMPGIWTAISRSPWTPCAARPVTRT